MDLRRTLVFSVVVAVGAVSAQATPRTYVVNAPHWGQDQAAAVAAAGGSVDFSHDGAGLAVVSSEADDFAARLRASGAFSSVDEDMVVEWQKPTQTVALEELAVTPNDHYYRYIQWAPQAVDAPAAWDAGYTGRGVRVAIVDGGIHSTHIDLRTNLDVAASRSFVPGFAFNQDTGTLWHGTHVAGIVAAANNSIGSVGIAPDATLVGVKVLHSGSGSFGWVIAGILYAATPLAEGGGGADIINMSLGAVFPRGGGNTGAGPLVAAMAKAVNYADRHGVLVVSAAGNDGLDLDQSASLISVPAESGSGIAVSSTGPVGFALGATNFRRQASYTNIGTSVIHVAAPGGDFALPGNAGCTLPFSTGSGSATIPCWAFDMVISTSRGSGASISSYTWTAGTSMAAPAASAVAALIKQKNPGISLGELKAKLAQSADDEGKKGTDPVYGKGFVNAGRAVQ